MIETNQIAIRLNPADLGILDAIMRRTGFSSAGEVVRVALRKLAATEGIDVLKVKPIASRASTRAAKK